MADGFGQILVVLFFALPLASLVLLARRSWLGVLPLAISIALFAEWFLYYATNWFGHVSGGSAVLILAVVLVGWLAVWVGVRTCTSSAQLPRERETTTGVERDPLGLAC